jgi:drug/metabolite transporter (DMT)-like permease
MTTPIDTAASGAPDIAIPRPASSRDIAAPGGPSNVRVWAGIWTIYLVWGSTYLGIAVAVETIPPFFMASTRFILAGGALLLWTILRERRAWRAPSRVEVRDTAIVAALLLGGGMGLVAYGEQSVPSGIAAIFIAMMPLWLAVYGRVLLGERLPALVVAGIGLGLVGVAILVSPGDASMAGVQPLALIAVIVSPMSWALGTLFAARRAHLPDRPLVATGLQMALGSVILLAMGLVTGEGSGWSPADVSSRSLVALVYLTLIGSLLGFTVFAWLLRVAPLPKLSTYAYVNPIVAVILGAIILGEPITPRTVLAGGVIVAAVALIITARGRAGRRAAADERRLSEAIADERAGSTEPVGAADRAGAGDRAGTAGRPPVAVGRAGAVDRLPADAGVAGAGPPAESLAPPPAEA